MKNIAKFSTLMVVILIATLCSLVLMILAFGTARADLSTANRYGDTVRETYQLESQGQEWLKDADQKIQEGQKVDFQTVIGDTGGRHLEIEIARDSSTYNIIKWELKPREITKQGLDNLLKRE